MPRAVMTDAPGPMVVHHSINDDLYGPYGKRVLVRVTLSENGLLSRISHQCPDEAGQPRDHLVD